jgi:hypothetical protein
MKYPDTPAHWVTVSAEMVSAMMGQPRALTPGEIRAGVVPPPAPDLKPEPPPRRRSAPRKR